MKSAMRLIALTVVLAATAPAHAAAAKYNAANIPRVATQSGVQPGVISGKLAYYYTRGLGADRSVNVLAFTTPSTGIYCIQPSFQMGLGGVFPLVSIERSASFGESLVAFWVDTKSFSDCPAKNLEVQTYDISTPGTPALTGNAAFDLVVP